MKEPPRISDIHQLQPYVADRVEVMYARLRARGYDPKAVETFRSYERQKYLYSIGRTHLKTRKPVTWTMNSKHRVGKAVDTCSKSRGYNWPEFFKALAEEAKAVGLHTIPQEACHVEWQG